jgi:multiple sugar transport system substrate-binding protein
MKKIKEIVSFVLLFIMIFTFAGCSKDSKTTKDESGDPNTGTKTEDTDKTGETVTELKLWHMEEPANRVERFQSIINKFNEEHPDIKVTVEVQSWNDAYTKFPAAIMAGSGPDLLATIPDHCTVIYDLGVVQPVTDIVNAIDAEQNYYDSAIAPYVYGDDVYAVPVYGMGQVLWYRADMFKEAGLTPPTNWEELIACAKALTKDGVYGIALPASLSMATDQVLYSFMASAGAEDVISGDNSITFNNEGTIKAFETYYELLKYSPEDSNTYTWGEPQALLNSGKVAMAIEKGQYLATFESESGVAAENLGCVVMPAMDAEHESKSIFYSNAFMLLSKDAAKKEAAGVFFEWLMGTDVYGDWLNAEPGLFVPLTEKGAASDLYLSDTVLQKYPTQLDTLLSATSNGCLFGFTDGVCMDIGKITGPNLLAQTLHQMTVNNLSAKDAVAWGEGEMKKAVE